MYNIPFPINLILSFRCKAQPKILFPLPSHVFFFNPPCPVRGTWHDWSAWSACSGSCSGVQTRTRNCTDPTLCFTPCRGDSVQWRNCGDQMSCCGQSAHAFVQHAKQAPSVSFHLVHDFGLTSRYQPLSVFHSFSLVLSPSHIELQSVSLPYSCFFVSLTI